MPASRFLPALLALALGAAPIRAQVVDNDISWVQLFHEQRLDARWALFGDLQLRRAALDGSEPQQLLARPGITYTVSPAVRLAGGYAYIGTARYGDAPAATPFPEHRLWQQLLVNGPAGTIAWQGRFRLEQRWIGTTRALPGGNWEVADWTFRQRFRAMARATVDAPKLGIAEPRLYLTVWNEAFFHLFEPVSGRSFDQNRASLQVGWRFSPRLRVEVGALEQYVSRGPPRLSERNRGLLVTVWTTAGAP